MSFRLPDAVARIVDGAPADPPTVWSRAVSAVGRLLERQPPIVYLLLFYAAYTIAGGFARKMQIIPGHTTAFWPPAGIFVATLLSTRRETWGWWVLTGCLAEMTCNVLWFRNNVPAALGFYVANALEALTAAWLLKKFGADPFRLESIREVSAFVVLGAGFATIVGATVGSATHAVFGTKSFSSVWLLWWLGDGAGLLISGPLALTVLQLWQSRSNIDRWQAIEALALAVVLIAGGMLVFNGYLLTAYMLLPPLLWAALRFQLRGAAVALALATLITASYTIGGRGEFTGQPELMLQRVLELKTFLSIAAISTLVVGALSQMHRQALRTVEQTNANLERLVAERTASLEASEARVRSLGDNLPDTAVYQYAREPDGRRRFLFASAGIEQLNSVRIADVLRDPAVLHAQIDEAYRKLLDAAEERSARELSDFDMDVPMRRADGTVRWMRLKSRPSREPNGRVIWDGVQIDITERKRTEEQLRYQLQLTRKITETVGVSIFVNDPDGNISFVNPEAERVFGYSLNELKGKSLHEIVHYKYPDGRPFPIAECPMGFVYEHGEGVRDYEGVFWRKDGAPVDVLCSSLPIMQDSKTVGDVIAVMDITERKRLEHALRDREERLRLFVTHAPAAIAMFDTDMRYLAVSDRWMSDYKLEQSPIGRSHYDVFPDLSQEWKAVHQRCMAGAVERSDGERFQRVNGCTQWLKWEARPWRFGDGSIGGILIAAEDITERMRIEEQMKLLMHEVNHRAKNILSLVQAIARQTAAGEPEEFSARFSQRLQAVAANLDLLVQSSWSGVEVESLVTAQLAPFKDLIGLRIRLSGPRARLTATAAQAIGLALHELATNASKYGALSNAQGFVEISWRLEGNLFAIKWAERGGPAVSPPTHKGFGSTVLAAMAKMTVGGEVTLDYAPGGVMWQLTCSAERALELNNH